MWVLRYSNQIGVGFKHERKKIDRSGKSFLVHISNVFFVHSNEKHKKLDLFRCYLASVSSVNYLNLIWLEFFSGVWNLVQFRYLEGKRIECEFGRVQQKRINGINGEKDESNDRFLSTNTHRKLHCNGKNALSSALSLYAESHARLFFVCLTVFFFGVNSRGLWVDLQKMTSIRT